MMIHRLLAAMLLCAFALGTVHAAEASDSKAPDASLSVLLDTIRDNRRALIAVNLNLTEDEAAKFWPIYDRYQAAINVVGDRMAALIEDYIAHFRDLSNDKAVQLISDYLGAEADRLRVRRDYLPEFAKVLPGRTVARFYQIENKMDAVLRYDLASTIPVVEEPGAAPAN